MHRTTQGSAQSFGGYGMRVWGPLEDPQGRIWLDLGKDRRAARQGECLTWECAEAPVVGSSRADSGCAAEHFIPGPSKV